MRIVHYPHPILRQTAVPIRRVDAQLRDIVAEMFEAMYAEKGVGLAANQVDLPLRLFVSNPAGNRDEGEEFVFINPVLSRHRGSCELEEGCLSLPGLHADIRRPEVVRVQSFNLQGEAFDADVDGFLARIIQHELDHLNGALFFDRLPEAERKAMEVTLEEFEIAFSQRRREGAIPSDEQLQTRWREWIDRYGK